MFPSWGWTKRHRMENFNPFSELNGGDDGTRTRDLCRDSSKGDVTPDEKE